MAAIDFPSSPTTGQTFTSGGVTWIWDGVKWTTGAAAGSATPLAMNDNRIINGDMRIDQRNNGASGTANGITVDRWQYYGTQASKGNWGRNLVGVSGTAGFPYCLGYQTSSAYTPLAADTFTLSQAIEADMVSDFSWGGPAAQPVTLSFWAHSNQAGVFSGSIKNYAGTRSYPFSFSLPADYTWVKFAITVPGDTTGVWTMLGNAGSMYVQFDLGSGANNRGPANAWASANYSGVTGSVSVVSTLSASFFVTGVKLEIGSVATPYNRQSLAKSMADCQRYYQYYTTVQTGYATAGGGMYWTHPYNVFMRAAPTVVFSNQSYSNASALTTYTIGTGYVALQLTVTATGSGLINANMTLSAEL